MSIKRVSPSLWAIKVCVRVPGVPNPVTKREKFTGTRVEAQCREAEIIKSLKTTGRSLTVAKLNGIKTFADAVKVHTDYLKTKGRYTYSTHKKYEFVSSMFGHLPLLQVPDHLQQYRIDASVKGVTKNSYTACVGAVFQRLVKRKILEKNPINPEDFPRYEIKARDRVLTPDEQIRLFTTIAEHEPHILPLIRFMLLVPCRVSELTSARREQYLPLQNMIYIPNSKAKIPIMKPIPYEMREYFENLPSDCPWLFYRRDSHGKYKPLTHSHDAWRRCLKKAGIEDLRRHDLRHHSVTNLLNLGNNIRDIMAVCGWKTDMTQTYYHKDIIRSAGCIKFQTVDVPMALSGVG